MRAFFKIAVVGLMASGLWCSPVARAQQGGERSGPAQAPLSLPDVDEVNTVELKNVKAPRVSDNR